MPRSLQILWRGADSSTWDLTDLRSTANVVSLGGLGFPSFDQQFSVSGARDGRRYEGTQYRQNTLEMAVSIGDIDPLPGRKRRRRADEWRLLDRAWRKSLSPEITGRLTVITGDTRRHIDLRMDQVVSPPATVDPALIGEATYAYVLTADDQPWWQGDPVDAEFSSSQTQKPFFSGGSGNRLYISDSNRLGSARITNTGDRPVAPKWWARGPFSSAIVGVGDDVVTIPFSRPTGQTVYVDSDEETILDGSGNSLWPLMGFADPTFAPIQPGESVQLTTVLNDPSSQSAIGVSIVPLFEGPW